MNIHRPKGRFAKQRRSAWWSAGDVHLTLCNRSYAVHTFNLDDVDVVKGAARLVAVPLLENRLVDEVGGGHRRLEELAAVEGETRLLESHRAAFIERVHLTSSP